MKKLSLYKNNFFFLFTRTDSSIFNSTDGKLSNNQKGASAILFAVLVMIVMLTIGLGVSRIILNQLKMTTDVGQSVTAFYAAEAGAEKCLYQVRKPETGNCDTPGGSLDESLTLSGASYNAVRIDDSEDRSITSLGLYKNVVRKVELKW